MVSSLAVRAAADDWPQWRGPRRDGVSAETGLLRAWPAGGPKLAWRAAGVGTGYASVVVGGGRVYTIGRHENDVVATALDETTGQPVWTRKIGTTSRIPGSTPTLDGDRLYALDPDGDLVCLDAATGEIRWQKSFLDDFAGRMMSGRGYGESPLIDGQRLLCTPGGPEAALVALDKRTGAVVWKGKLPALGPAGRDGAGFSSIVVTEAAGVRQYVQLMGRGLVGFDARDGRFLWAYNTLANDTANIPTPVVDNEFVFAANGYTAGSVLLKLVPDAEGDGTTSGVKAEVVYALNGGQFQNHHGGVVRLGNRIYGGHGNNNGLPTCLDVETGRVLWKRRGPGVGSAAVVCADGHLYFRYQNGVVALIEATDRGYNLHGTLEVPGAGGDSWSHPVVTNGRLYLREQDALWVYDVRAGSQEPALVETPSRETPVDPATAELRRRGVSVEMSSSDRQTGSPAGPRSVVVQRRAHDFAVDGTSTQNDDDQRAPDGRERAPLLITFTNAHLTRDGMLTDEILGLVKQVAGPLVISLAGTQAADAVLQQLQAINPVALNLELCSRITDDGLAHLQAESRLRALILTGTTISAAGIRRLAKLGRLAALDLELCDQVTDAACEPLGTMRQLRYLSFKKSGFEKERITDAGLQNLHALHALEVLNLYGNKLTDDGLEHLQPLSNLRELNLSLLPISDAGLRHLTRLEKLERLELLYSEGFAGPKLTDAGVESLAQLSRLAALNLTGAKLTDDGLAGLKGLKNLRRLQLVRTKAGTAGIEHFRAAVPECEIVR
jgi:outer membrane protein assembly factor BamB